MTNPTMAIDQRDPQLRAFAILAQVARARGQVYRWLALGFFPPDDELARALQSGHAVREIEIATMWLGQDQKRLHPSLVAIQSGMFSLNSLALEFERYFGKSAERISMRESTYRWREASSLLESASDLSRALRQEYGQFGVTPAVDQEDKLPVEFEFMAFLCERESKEWNNQASESARQLRRQERAFLDDHLVRWYPEFCWRVTQQSNGSFYSELARFADIWLKLEYGPGYTPARSKV